MPYKEDMARLAGFREQIAGIRQKMREVQASVRPELVADYEFSTPDGSRSLSALFGDKHDLFVIHNMGESCLYCTLWADGFNGIYPHIADRAAVVVASPDPSEVQRRFAESRGWRFPMVSHHGTSFAADMGYRSENGGWLPGVSVFRRDGNRMVRVSDTSFHPNDDFCTLWQFLELLPDGPADWQPRFSYG
jgi:predicted dithiol-disulfide oxidoreductase (DUF899 family)